MDQVQLMIFEDVKDYLNELTSEIHLAIALSRLSKSFFKDILSEKFNNTYSAHSFTMCRMSVDYSLALSICRCHDHRDDSHGLTAFFKSINSPCNKEMLAAEILTRRKKYVNQVQANIETEDHIKEIDQAWNLHKILKESNEFSRIKNFRHTYIAHRAKRKANIHRTERAFLHELVDRSQIIVQLLNGAILGRHDDFNGSAENWDLYSECFTKAMIHGAIE